MEETATNMLNESYRYNSQLCETIVINESTQFDQLFLANNEFLWLNLSTSEETLIQQLGTQLSIHELVIEDILHPSQRPKIEDFENYTFVTLKMPHREAAPSRRISYEQISIIILKNGLITFRECQDNTFDLIRQKLNKKNSRLRQSGSDTLLYLLLDTLVDRFMDITDDLSDEIDYLESVLVEEPTALSLSELYTIKRNMMGLRKSLMPLRDITSYLMHDNVEWINTKTLLFLRDCHDHVVRTLDNLDLLRDIVANMLDIYLSSMNNKMNEVMKVLAVFATIFIPLTFITSLYGMNFSYMPELKWHYGYFGVLGLMVLIVCCLIIFFKRKRWF
ncbi:MAG: magnesium/cobalt transporter CorA [Legionellales bacterium]|nr:magnesium/cobalt transporter CorA [Legionellales bacterium]